MTASVTLACFGGILLSAAICTYLHASIGREASTSGGRALGGAFAWCATRLDKHKRLRIVTQQVLDVRLELTTVQKVTLQKGTA